MSEGGPLVPQLTPNLENISKIERTTSLALIMKKYRANLGVDRMKNGAATAASAKFKCYNSTIITTIIRQCMRDPGKIRYMWKPVRDVFLFSRLNPFSGGSTIRIFIAYTQLYLCGRTTII